MASLVRTFSIISLCFSVFFSLSANSMELIDQSANLFAFQQKLAKKGNPVAQYRLGFMYERGIGIAKDKAKAASWYQEAANQGNKDARNRLVYMDIQRNGYQPEKQSAWLKKLQVDSANYQPEAMFLLAQLYAQGLAVKQNRDKALDILYRLSAEGLAAAETEIYSIEATSQAPKRAGKVKKAPTSVSSAAPEKATAVKATQKVVAKDTPVKKQSTGLSAEVVEKQTAEAEREKKRQKYLAIMKKLAEEQAQLEETQRWASGDSVARVDDEI